MEYRQLPHGDETEKFSVLGLGTGGLHQNSDEEIEAVVRTAIQNGINFFDLCAGGSCVYAPFGRAIAGKRGQVFFQLHFGAVYNEKGEYAWTRDLKTIQSTFEWELATLGTDYTDFGFLHCVDEDEDFDELVQAGILDYVQALKTAGRVRHIGFSSHTPSVANRLLDTGLVDMMMFSINPAYDLEQGDELGVTPVEVKEIVYQATAYLGMGRVLPFLHVVNDVLASNGVKLPLDGQATTTAENRLEAGEQTQVDIFGEGMRGFSQSGPEESRHINRWLSDNCFGDYYTRTGLDYKQREMITFCFLAAQGGCEPQLTSHAAANIAIGNDKAFLIQIISQCLPYIGYPRSLNALRCVNEAAQKNG